MDTTNGQTNNGTTINNSPSGSSSKPPPWVWVLVALASALTLGIILYGSYTFIRRRRAKRQRLGDGEADGNDVATRGGGLPSPRRPWDRRRRRSRSQPGTGSRWGWVHPHHRASTQSSEGLNELGEAPPPYNEDDLEPCLNMSMVEVNAGLGLGGGPSRVASRQDRGSRVGDSDMDLEGQQQEVHPRPPTYDFAVNLGTAATATTTTSSSSSSSAQPTTSSSTVQPPPPAIVVSEDRSMRVE